MLFEGHRPKSANPPLLVFAGVTDNEPYLEAICRRRVEAVMVSYEDLWRGKHNWWPDVRQRLDGWQQARYLDSGAFTFLNRPDTVTLAEVEAFFAAYLAFLGEHLADFDFIFDFDLDRLTIDGIRGVELTRRHRRVLRDLAGPKLIPVWHVSAGLPAWRELLAEYPYLSIGFDGAKQSRPDFAYLVDLAHRGGVRVHALGVASFDTLRLVPYDSADSTGWLSAQKYGKFAGTQFTDRKAVWTAEEHLAAYRLEDDVRAVGYDPTLLWAGTETDRLEIAIALMQRQEERLRW